MPNMQASFNVHLVAEKRSCFDLNRQFLPMNHPFRQDTKNFTKGVVVEDHPPLMLTGADILAQLNALKEKEGGGYEGYRMEHNWTQISGLWRLPYMCDILLLVHLITCRRLRGGALTMLTAGNS
jgi:hypothetical protein